VTSGLEIAPLPDRRGLRLAGELDFSTAPSFTEALRAFAPDDEVHLDLAELVLVDSAGLHAFLGFARARGKGSVVLLNPTASVMRSFEVACIDKHPAIEIRQARAAMRSLPTEGCPQTSKTRLRDHAVAHPAKPAKEEDDD
jgi:anti-anti-sigma factor